MTNLFLDVYLYVCTHFFVSLSWSSLCLCVIVLFKMRGSASAGSIGRDSWSFKFCLLLTKEAIIEGSNFVFWFFEFYFCWSCKVGWVIFLPDSLTSRYLNRRDRFHEEFLIPLLTIWLFAQVQNPSLKPNLNPNRLG